MRRPPLRGLAACAALAMLAGSPAASSAEGAWFSLGVLAGATNPDPSFSDYRWDVTPRPGYGAQALVGTGPVALGLRAWTSRTTQDLGLAGVPDPAVGVTTLDLVGEARLVTYAGVGLNARMSVGRVRVAYAPGRIETTAGGAPVTIELATIEEWNAGLGAGLRRAIGGPWVAGIEVDRRSFGMDTAHRAGDEIAVGRRAFGDWSARIELSWLRGL